MNEMNQIPIMPPWTDPNPYWERHPWPADWQELRQQAWNEAQALGVPDRKTEAFKYLNLKVLKSKSWQRSSPVKLSSNEVEDLRALIRREALPGACLLVLVDGFWLSEFSQLGELSVQDLASLSQATDREVDYRRWILWLEKVKSEQGAKGLPRDYFDCLNQAHFDRGAALHVPAECRQLIQILSVGRGQGQWSPFQVYVDIGSRASCRIYETHVSLGGREISWSHPEFRVRLGESAHLEWTFLQDGGVEEVHLGRTRFFLEKDSQFRALHVAMGSRLARQALDFQVFGSGVHAQLNGLTLSGPGQSLDFHTLVEHRVGHSETRQLYKGILGSDAHAVFNGRVVIHAGAQKASSEQLNQNLLLSDRSEIDSKPELEVFADDVKATHGSAVGQMSEEEIFYLRSRAIGENEAKEMLALGAVTDLVAEISDPALRELLQAKIRTAYQRLSQQEPVRKNHE